MGRFIGSTSNADPLLIQLEAVSKVDVVVAFSACGENQAGFTTRPTISRPDIPGTASSAGTAVIYSPSGVASGSELLTSFATAPSLPAPGEAISGPRLPLRVHWQADPRNGFVVPLGGFICLSAITGSGVFGGHTWMGELVWEEQ